MTDTPAAAWLKRPPHTLLPRARTRHAVLLSGAIVLLFVMCVLSLAIGPTGIGLLSLPSALMDQASTQHLVLVNLRLPRTILGGFVGAALAIAGAMMQGLFRNPLADPGLIGVSSGAALAAVATIALGHTWVAQFTQSLGVYALPCAAFVGGLGTTLLLMAIARRNGQVMVGTLLLAGIAVAALAGSLTGLISYASDDRELRDLTLWSLGSLAGASWAKVAAIVPFAVLLAFILPRTIRALNGLMLGEAEAFHLGINVERAKDLVVVATAAAVGAAVAVAGVVGFVGIVVPHIVRLLGGPDNRFVLPASAILGATLVIAADVAARMAVRPAELPLGIVLAAIGAPVFIHLIMRRGIGGGE